MTKKDNIGICKYCDTDKKLMDAHILPKCFFKTLKKGNDFDFLVYNSRYKGKIKSGVFDRNILCVDCDNLFSKYEKETIKLFRLDLSKYVKSISDCSGTAFYYSIPDNVINPKYIVLFFISFLWKCSISTRTECSDINLGIYENIFKNALKTETIPDCFDITMAYFCDDATGKESTSFPIRTRSENGINYYEFYFNGFDIRIKVDKRTINPFKISSIQNKGILILERKDFANCSYRKSLIKMAHKNYNKEVK